MSTAAAAYNTGQENNHQPSSFLSVLKIIFIFLHSLLLSKLIRRVVNLIYGRNPTPDVVVVSSATDLPTDVLLNCLARVPRRYDPILSCVSKSFRSIVLSPDLPQVRSLMGIKDDPLLYVRFSTETRRRQFHWFTFNPNEKTASDHCCIPFLSQLSFYCSSISIGSKIYFIGGALYNSSRVIWRLDTLSGELSKGPNMRVPRVLPGVAVVDGKIYVMGGCFEDHIKIEIFNLKTEGWEIAPLSPHGEVRYGEMFWGRGIIVHEAVAVDGKVYVIGHRKRSHIIYNTKDGTCEIFEMASETWWRGGVCVIDNVIYVCYIDLGLMWYDSKKKVWRVVQGLKLPKLMESVGMVDCNGKLAFLWGDRDYFSGDTKMKIWCMMVVLDRSEAGIYGMVQWSDSVGCVPLNHRIWHCLDVSR